MQIHHLTRRAAMRKSRRVGRGGKRGTYSGRGIKGLGARAGGKFRPEERDTLKKIPKLRGYRFKPFRQKPAVVGSALLARKFSEGETVSPETLHAKRIVRRIRGRMPQVKILGAGNMKKKFVFKGVMFSRSAEAQIRS
ncbi:MAG: uL15m family ribosomal protein [Patescibacteria group bacterium]